MDNMVKVCFNLEVDEDGWPPVSMESVWAKPGINENEYIIANVPFFATRATIDDTVRVRKDGEGVLWFDSIVKRSTNSLIRVIVNDLGTIEEVHNRLVALGCNTELGRNFKLIAVNVPAGRLSEVQAYLKAELSADSLGYEEPILRE